MSYLKDGTRTTMTNVRIPFTDEFSDAEFIANFALSALIGIHGFIGYIGLEVVMALDINVMRVTPKLVEIEFNKLDKSLKEKTLTKTSFLYTFNNIVKQCLDIDK